MDVSDADDEELQRALALSRETEQPAALPPPPAATPADTVVLGQIPAKFRIIAAAAAGRTDLEPTGKILLPQSCLSVFCAFLGDMPPTLLLRLVGGDGSGCIVGVFEFIEDAKCSEMLAAALGAQARTQQMPRLFDRGPLAVCFVPRWVRGALLIDPITPEAHVQIVSLPLASHMLLRPREDAFAASLAAHGDGDVRTTLTNLMNRYPAISTQACLPLVLDGVSHLVDVVSLKGWRHVRCGICGERSLPPAGAAHELVPAACLVDADVEVDFAPSAQAEAAEAKVKAEIQAKAKAMVAAVAAERAASKEALPAAAGAVAAPGNQTASAEADTHTSAPTDRQAMAIALLASLLDGGGSSSSADGVGGDGSRIVKCAAKLPDGSRASFELPSDAPLAALWWSIDAKGELPGLPPGRDYALATSYPRRRFLRPADGAAQAETLRSSGLADAAQQAFFVEHV